MVIDTLLLHLISQESLEASEVLYKDSMVHFDDNRKWRERFVVIRTDYSLELHDSLEVLIFNHLKMATVIEYIYANIPILLHKSRHSQREPRHATNS